MSKPTRQRTAPIIAERHDEDKPWSRSRALMEARNKLGPKAHVRRVGRDAQVGIFNNQGGFEVKASGLTFNAALKRAKK